MAADGDELASGAAVRPPLQADYGLYGGGRRRFAPGVVAAVAVGGAAGALLRLAIGRAVSTSVNGFPWATLIVNLVGSFVLGFVIGAARPRASRNRYLLPLIGTGFCGGLTTFSTFAVELDLLVRAGHLVAATAYVIASLVGGLTTAWVALVLGRSLGRPGEPAE